ncbi:sporulation histidine kinase inhibitor Sda [Salibacterium salarium]|uniref:Sporulation histidine kinase inhibitor Sda n=1 Tax=Salibacterium salarium TaxID=284579 RepID=A0A3R9P4F5_9BACI|nr:sporulation histidine kinase inhibitor Sda [Salibacterium salarium]RSL32593.1 sporulation histidine kinase inhibitor Sda [Salibacterium salarium]
MELRRVSTSVLLESYEKAKRMDLDDEFVHLLKETLEDRLYTTMK